MRIARTLPLRRTYTATISMHTPNGANRNNPMTKTAKTPSKPKSRYRDGRRATTVVLQSEFVKLGQEFFPKTNSGCLSGFFDKALAAYFRKNAAKIRKMGLTVPDAAFAK